MTLTTTSLRALGALSAGMLTLGMLAACTPTPEPKPTKTALFTSDEEAFAAAEETYRAYLRDLNATDLSDAKSFEPVFAWLTDSALASEKESLSLYHAEGLTRTGETTYDAFEPVGATPDSVVANICLNVSQVDLVGEDGNSVLTNDRAPRRALEVTFTEATTSTGLQISSNHAPDAFSC